MVKQVESLNQKLPKTRLTRANLPQYLPAGGAARNAVDCALWRLEYQTAFPLQVFAIKPKIITAMTVSLDTPKAMAKQTKALCELGAKLVKVKLNHELVIERVQAVRESAPPMSMLSSMPTKPGGGA